MNHILSMRGLATLLAIVVSTGCADLDDSAMGAKANNGPPVGDTVVVEAENRLFEHDVQAANQLYTNALSENPNNGQFAAGKAVTDLLLLPYSPEVSTLLTESLGAARPLEPSSEVIYRPEGLLDLLSRGVSFQDDGAFSGIETLLESELPWQRGRLESAQEFTADLDTPVNGLLDNLVAIADALETTQDDLDVALTDAAFGSYYLPGTVFFDDSLTLDLGRPEIAFIRAGVAGTRALIYFAAAYENSWSLADAFGPRWESIALDAEDPLFIAGYTYDDYVTAFLGEVLGRDIRDASRLSASRDAARLALVNVRSGLEFGVERLEASQTDRVLTFDEATPQATRDVVDFIAALEDALYQPTPLPFTEPDVTLDLSSFFEDGRTLPAQTPWFVRVTTNDDFGETTSWEIGDAAFETFFVSGVFTPEFTAETAPTVTIDSGDPDRSYTDLITGEFSQNVESTYGTR